VLFACDVAARNRKTGTTNAKRTALITQHLMGANLRAVKRIIYKIGDGNPGSPETGRQSLKK
jgi:hypothetical protein